MTRKSLRPLLLPAGVLAVGGVYFWLWRFSGLPEYRELIHLAQNLLNNHGLWIISIAALVEGLLLIGNYLPGGLVIFLAVISAGNDFGKIISIVVLVCLGYAVANVINYLLGKFGWYRVLVKFGLGDQLAQAGQKWTDKSFKVIFFSYWQANLAAVTATAAGVLKINFAKFLKETSISLIFWHSVWAVLVYVFREQAVNVITNTYIIFAVALAVAIYLSVKQYKAKPLP